MKDLQRNGRIHLTLDMTCSLTLGPFLYKGLFTVKE